MVLNGPPKGHEGEASNDGAGRIMGGARLSEAMLGQARLGEERIGSLAEGGRGWADEGVVG